MIQDLAGVGYALSSLDAQLVTLGRSNGDPEPGHPVEGMPTTPADGAEGAGGRLDVRSRPGHATTIKATVPLPAL